MLGERKCPNLVCPTKPDLCEKFDEKTLDGNLSRLYYFLGCTDFINGKVFPNWSTHTTQIYYRYEITDDRCPFVDINSGFRGITTFTGCPAQPESFVQVDKFGKKCQYVRTLVYNTYLYPMGAMHSGRKYVLGYTHHDGPKGDDINLLQTSGQRDWLSSIYCEGFADWSAYATDINNGNETQKKGDIYLCDIGEYALPRFTSWDIVKADLDTTFESYSELVWKDFMAQGYTWKKMHDEVLTWKQIHFMGTGITYNNLGLYNA